MASALNEQLNQHRQGWDLDRLLRIGASTVQIKVHQDTSYAHQSHARADVWTPSEGGGGSWNLLATYHYGEWANDRHQGMRDYGTTGLYRAADELQRLAELVLLGPPEVSL